MLSNMRLSTKLMGSVAASLLLTLILGVASTLWLRDISRTMDYAVAVAGQRRLLANQLHSGALKLQSIERSIMLRSILQQMDAVERNKQEFRETADAVRGYLAGYVPLADDDVKRQAIDTMSTRFGEFFQAHDEMVRHLDKQQFDLVQKVTDDKILPRIEAVSSETKHLAQQDSLRMKSANDDARSKAGAGLFLVIVLTGAGMAIGAVAFWIVGGVSRTLRVLASSMAEGAGQVAAAAMQVASASQSLAQASSEQAASLEETAASAQELSTMTRNNEDHTRLAADSVIETDRQVKMANDTLEKMVGSMQEINASSRKISKIIRVIDEIAFQTNILALNAAVEAARAGEAGMGFAVVADEVRNLSQRCAQAASDTSALIEESITTTNDGSGRLKQVVESIGGINQQASRVKELVSQVSHGSQEQSRSIDQISSSVAQMQRVTQNTAANAEQGASASQQLSAHAESMRATVGSLYSMVGGDYVAKARVPRFDRVGRSGGGTALAALKEAVQNRADRKVAPLTLPRDRAADGRPNDGDFTSF